MEDFITTDKDRGYIDKVGHDYIIVKDIFSGENITLNVDLNIAEHFKKECSYGDVIYVCYDKEKKELL